MTDSIEGFRLSPQQERLWLLQQDAGAFNAQCTIHIAGNLKVDLLIDSLRRVIESHDTLRTTFYCAPSVKMPIQIVSDKTVFDWRIVDLERNPGADRVAEIEKETTLPFDLLRGPLVRALLLSISSEDHLLILTLPSIVADGHSLSNLFRGLACLYSSSIHPEETTPAMAYAQYAEWQNQMVADETPELDEEYWRECGIWADTPTRLPQEIIKSNEPANAFATYSIKLSERLASNLDQKAEEYLVSIRQSLLSCWTALLWRLTRKSNLLIAVAFDGRIYQELDSAIGLYAKYLPAYYRLHDAMTYSELLGQVQKTDRYLQELQDRFSYGHFWLSRGKETSFLPFAFDFEHRCDPIESGGVVFSLNQRYSCIDSYKIKLSAIVQNDEFLAEFSYDPACFMADDIQRLAQQFYAIVESAADCPNERISLLEILGEDERNVLLRDLNQTKVSYSEFETPQALFEEQVRSTPDSIAIIFQNEYITFSGLNEYSNQIARYVQRINSGPEVVIALLLERSPILIAAILGVLKSGNAYVPLDPSYPKDRLEFMLADSEASILLTERRLVRDLDIPDTRVIYLDSSLDISLEESDECISISVQPENLAYLIYTSGSTGKPKGVMITHCGLRNYLVWALRNYRVAEGKGSLVHSSISFDLTVTSLFTPLLVGGSVTLLSEGADIAEIASALDEETDYSLVKITPTHMMALNSLLNGGEAKRKSRVLVVGGEALKSEMVEGWRDHSKDCRIINEYGPTETVVGSCIFEVPDDYSSEGVVPIGSPIANTDLYVLDSHLIPAPINVPGELYIGGDGLARGYFARPDITADKFIPHPFSDKAGARLYKTGDEAKRLADGSLVFLGRVDHMVKIRGYRVEPGEIESVLCQHPLIREAVVILREDSPDGARLVAYYIPESKSSRIFSQRDSYALPNGLQIVHINKNETDLLYRDIFIDESYVKCGISLSDGDVILDIGANIGLFTLYISQKLPEARIYAFEPVAPIFEKLKMNTELHGVNAKVFNYGASDQTKEAKITYYPRASAMSGIYADTKEEANLMMEFLSNQDSSLAEYADDFLEGRFESESFNARFKRLSDILRENEINSVDLLKIDVEKSELDVLLGIDYGDWHKIKQIVIEIHDIEDRLKKISELLIDKGYEINIEQELLLEHTNLYNLYAIRRSWASEEKIVSRSLEPLAQESVSASIPTLDLRNFLARKLPGYMIPSSFVRLDSLPLNSNGKLDREALPPPGRLLPEMSRSFIPPRTDTERVLAGIWKQVLRLDEVGVQDNFFELGGDSIATIQVVAKAKQAGLHFIPKQMFQSQTIAELALKVTVVESPRTEQGLVLGTVPLTPIQQYLFDQNLLNLHHFNQSVLLEMQQNLDGNILSKVLDGIIIHHDALRMRFEKQGSYWHQTIAPSIGSTVLTEIDISCLKEPVQSAAIEMASAQMQTSLNLQKGPLLRVGLFETGSDKPARLLIAVHHLIIDGVSWRILLEDIATAYKQLSSESAIELPAKTTSFKQWAGRLIEYGRSDAVLNELPFWLQQANSRQPSSYTEDAQIEDLNTVGSARILRTVLDRDSTRVLLQEVSKFYRAQINEVLLAAMAVTFCRWKEASTLRVDIEGHGREELFDDVDTSRTVGWFTTIFPVTLEIPVAPTIDASFIETAITRVKEQLRAIPRKGIGYGLLRYLNDSTEILEQLGRISRAEVSFNYLGRFDSIVSDHFLYRLANEAAGQSRSPDGLRQYLFEVNGQIIDDRLEVEWSYCEKIFSQDTVENLMNAFNDALRLIITQCQGPEMARYSPVDFPLAKLDRHRLNLVTEGINDIDDIYQLTPIQQGILFHALYTPETASYSVPLSCKFEGYLDIEAFKTSWQRALDRNPVLRTIFIWEKLEQPLQVVLRQVELPWVEYDWRNLSEANQDSQLAIFLEEDRSKAFDLAKAPLMRFSLIALSERSWHFIWTFHHLLLDGWSLSILLKEVLNTYKAIKAGKEYECEARRPYSDYVAWINQQDLSGAEEFWRKTLKGIAAPTSMQAIKSDNHSAGLKPGYFEEGLYFTPEESQAVESVARRYRITLNTLVQGVWGILILHYSGEETAVFGTIVSGRSTELVGVEKMLGLFINTLPVRVNFDSDSEFGAWLSELQTQQAELRHYEYSPLADVQKWSDIPRGQPLFESIIVFENYPVETTLEQFQETINISSIYFKDPSHYPLTLMVASRDHLSIRMTYNRKHFSAEAVEHILEDFKSVLRSINGESDFTLRELREMLRDKTDSYRRMKADELEAKRFEKLKYTKRKPIRKG